MLQKKNKWIDRVPGSNSGIILTFHSLACFCFMRISNKLGNYAQMHKVNIGLRLAGVNQYLKSIFSIFFLLSFECPLGNLKHLHIKFQLIAIFLLRCASPKRVSERERELVQSIRINKLLTFLRTSTRKWSVRGKFFFSFSLIPLFDMITGHRSRLKANFHLKTFFSFFFIFETISYWQTCPFTANCIGRLSSFFLSFSIFGWLCGRMWDEISRKL